jgi:hypothetical protein
MTTRKLTSALPVLAALLFATAAHAGSYSMDAGSTAPEPVSTVSGGHGDCASAGPSVQDGSNGVAEIRDSTRSSTSTGTGRVPATATGSDAAASGSSASTESIGVPIKARNNRWQSLVPGAIK